jgi:hypothetical protein
MRHEKFEVPFLRHKRIETAVSSLVIFAVWLFTIARALPDRFYDRGIHVSVGERMLRGDVLYSTVYDNKEPLFLYFVALQRALGVGAELLAEIGLIIICSSAAYVIARSIGTARSALIVGFAAVPIIVTGDFYYPGLTHLPGTAATLALMALMLRNRLFFAGTLLPVVLFLKIPAFPIAGAAAVIWIWFRARFWDAVCFGAAAVAAGLLVIGLMALRGELIPFLYVTKGNISYSDGGLITGAGALGRAAAHIHLVGLKGIYIEITAITLCLALAYTHLSNNATERKNRLVLIGICVATMLSGVVVLALTGFWRHHTQILYISAVLSVICMARFFDNLMRRAFVPAVVASLCLAFILAGIPSSRGYLSDLANFFSRYARLQGLSPEAARLLSVSTSGTYARLGRNDEMGHAVGLRHWTLACPRFHQYPFESEAILNETFECASRSPTLLIGANLGTAEGGAYNWPAWKHYVSRIEELLSTHYTCDASSGLRVCVRRAP